MLKGDLKIRIIVENPPPDVAIQVQRGRDELVPPTRSTPDAIAFDLVVKLAPPRLPGQLRFVGDLVQGPPSARFVYVNSGKRAGQRDSCWDRRAKVPLGGITPDQASRVLEDGSLVLEGRIAGTGKDGGPMCASVPLIGGGWVVTAET